MSGSNQKAIPNVRECSKGLLGCLGVVGRPSRMTGRGLEALPDVREWKEGLPDVREW